MQQTFFSRTTAAVAVALGCMYFVGMHLNHAAAPLVDVNPTGSGSSSQTDRDIDHHHPHGPHTPSQQPSTFSNEVVLITAHFPSAVHEALGALKEHDQKGTFCGYFNPWHFDTNPANQISRDNVINGILDAEKSGHAVCLHIRGDLGLNIHQLRQFNSITDDQIQAPVTRDIEAFQKITGTKPKFALISRHRPDRMDRARHACTAAGIPYVVPDYTVPMGPQPKEIVDQMMNVLAESHSGRIIVEISEQALYTEVEMFKITDILRLALSRGVKFVQLSDADIQGLRKRQHLSHQQSQ